MDDSSLKNKKNKCVIFVANRAFALTNSRFLLMQHFLKLGWRVVAATALDKSSDRLLKTRVIIEPVEFDRGGLSLWHDMKAFFSLIYIFRKYRPQLIHHFHAKPMILGNLAVRFVGNAKVVNTVTGLGHAFITGGITRYLAIAGYRLLVTGGNITIFQNRDDMQLFIKNGWIPKDKARLIISSGVDTKRFYPKNLKKNETKRVLMVARLLWQKGVREFVEAAELIKREYLNVRFQLAGEWDPVHPDAVEKAWVYSAVNKGIIEFLGYIDNMEELLRTIDVFVLPSYYREGVPRVLLEAAACGVPVVTTNVPGCREVVVDGETGYLVPPRNSKALAIAINKILTNSALRNRMGQAGRRLVEKEFDIRAITRKQLRIYREIGVNVGEVGDI